MLFFKKKPRLTIIVPMHNSHERSRPLMATLAKIRDRRVDVVLVDDGSSAEEAALVDQDGKRIRAVCQVIHQECKGPGGARNSGLRAARGDYVWFVDSDDDIFPQAIDEALEFMPQGFDFIDFRVEKKGKVSSSMPLEPGAHESSELLDKFGRHVSKVFRKSFLTVEYPEYCFYEDNYLSMILTSLCRRYYVSASVGYRHIISRDSITRPAQGGIRPQFYDRMPTTFEAAKVALSMCRSADERSMILGRFRTLFLINTSSKIARVEEDDSVLERIVSAYKSCASELALSSELEPFLKQSRRIFIKRLSAHKCAQELSSVWDESAPHRQALQWFIDIRDSAWGRGIKYPELKKRA